MLPPALILCCVRADPFSPSISTTPRLSRPDLGDADVSAHGWRLLFPSAQQRLQSEPFFLPMGAAQSCCHDDAREFRMSLPATSDLSYRDTAATGPQSVPKPSLFFPNRQTVVTVERSRILVLFSKASEVSPHPSHHRYHHHPLSVFFLPARVCARVFSSSKIALVVCLVVHDSDIGSS